MNQVAKMLEVEVRDGAQVVEKIKRLLVKGCVLYRDEWFEVKQPGAYIDPFSDYPWEAQPLEPELARLFAWFCQNKKDIERVFDCEEIFVTDDPQRGIVCINRRRQ